MKGKYHLLSGIIFLIILLFVDFFLNFFLINFFKQNLFVVFFTFYLFFAGLLLPDSDKIGSWIFKFFLPFAVISWILGLVVSSLKGKKFRHRGFLHSFSGILLTSLVSSIICFLFLSIFFFLNFKILILFTCSILIGQLLHLLLDLF